VWAVVGQHPDRLVADLLAHRCDAQVENGAVGQLDGRGGNAAGRPVMSMLNPSCPADSRPTPLYALPVGESCSVAEVVVIEVFLLVGPPHGGRLTRVLETVV
jgi:hypothetical protein